MRVFYAPFKISFNTCNWMYMSKCRIVVLNIFCRVVVRVCIWYKKNLLFSRKRLELILLLIIRFLVTGGRDFLIQIFLGNFTSVVSHCLLVGSLIQFGFFDGQRFSRYPAHWRYFSNFPFHLYQVGFRIACSPIQWPDRVRFASH